MRIVSLALVVLALSTHNLSGQIPAKLSLADLRYLPGVWVLDLESSGLTGADAEQRTMTLVLRGRGWTFGGRHVERAKDLPEAAIDIQTDQLRHFAGKAQDHAVGAP